MIKPTAKRFTKEFLDVPKEYCLGLVHQGESRYWRFDLLESVGVVNDRLGDLDLVVYFDGENQAGSAWRTAEHQLTFENSENGIADRETNSTWDLKRGLATGGELKGIRLEAVPAIISFTHAWTRFHEDTTMWQLEKSQTP